MPGEAAVCRGCEEDLSTPLPHVDTHVSAILSEMVCSLPAAGCTLHELLMRRGDRGPLLLCMVLTVPFLLPASIPGSSLPFGAVIALNALSLITHRSPWLPERLLHRRLAAAHVERDGYAVLAGYMMLLLTLVYFVVVTMVGGVGVRTLLHNL